MKTQKTTTKRTHRSHISAYDKNWLEKCNEITEFVKKNKRRPSKYYAEEIRMHNWLKQQQKTINKGLMTPFRLENYKKLQVLLQKYRRVNQSAYLHQIAETQLFPKKS